MNIKISIGKDILDKDFIFDFESNPHLLISGNPRPGLVDMLHTVIRQLTTNNKPNEIGLAIIDVHRIELSVYKNNKLLKHPVLSDLSLLPKFFKNILDTKDVMSPLFIVIEELADPMILYPKETKYFLNRVIKKGNTHLVMGLQRPSEAILTESMLKDMSNIVTFRQNSRADSEKLLGNSNAVTLEDSKDFIYKNITEQYKLRLE